MVTDLNFFNIRSITYNVKGVFPTIFRYGKIVIETNEGKTIFEVNRLKKLNFTNTKHKINENYKREWMKCILMKITN